MPGGDFRELLTAYEVKFKRLLLSELPFIRLKQVITQRKLEDEAVHLNLINSFQRAIDLEIAELNKLQSEINKIMYY